MGHDTETTSQLRQRHVAALREAGLRATAPRLAVLEALEHDRTHPTVEMLHERIQRENPTVSLSTVYTTLESFLHRGLVRRIGAAGGRLRVDGTTQDHDHAICRICGAVYDVDANPGARPEPPSTFPRELRVQNVHVEYEVICPDCAEGA